MPGGSQESSTRIPTATPEEEADRQKIRELAGPQQNQFLALMALSDPRRAGDILKGHPDILASLQPFLQEEVRRQQMFESGGIAQLSPADQAQLDEAFKGARGRADESVLRLADELSGGRGLRMSDTPVADVAIRERARLAQDLESQAAMTRLNLGLGLRQFQVGLQQQRFGNQFGLTQGQSPFLPVTAMQQQERLAQPTTATSMRQPFAQTFSQIAGGAGGLALGAGLGFGGPAAIPAFAMASQMFPQQGLGMSLTNFGRGF